jgi:uncharacterized protein involved in cysteine biosynthesis
MDSIVQFITANWEGIAAIAVAAAYLFDKIAALTSTKVDDKIADAVESALAKFGIGKSDNDEAK